MSIKDSELIWEAYTDHLNEGWGKNLAMMGLAGLAAHGAMKHDVSATKPSPAATQSIGKSHKNNEFAFRHDVAKLTKMSNFVMKYNVPVDAKGNPALDLKTLNQLEQKHNLSITTPETYRAVQK